MGLKRNGPEDQNIIARAYENWTKEFVDIEDYGPTGSGPSRPPGFESRANGPTESKSDPYVEDTLHNQNLHDTIHSEAESTEQKGSEGSDDEEYDEIIRTRNIGRNIGLSTAYDGNAIQSFTEKRKERKNGNCKKLWKKDRKKRQQQRTDTGDSLSF